MDILIDSEIGAGQCTAAAIQKQLSGAKDGEDVRIVVNSPGGDCFEGFAVYNALRDFARSSKGTVTTYIQGMAASAASWIALAAAAASDKNRVIVEDNSVFMIHNCWGAVVGDCRAMRKSAELSERIDGIMAGMLARKSGRDVAEISAMMDEETWLFGKEIVKAGFADELADSGKKEGGKEDSMASAHSRYEACRKSARDAARFGMAEIKAAYAAVAEAGAVERALKLKLAAESEAAERLARARDAFSRSV